MWLKSLQNPSQPPPEWNSIKYWNSILRELMTQYGKCFSFTSLKNSTFLTSKIIFRASKCSLSVFENDQRALLINFLFLPTQQTICLPWGLFINFICICRNRIWFESRLVTYVKNNQIIFPSNTFFLFKMCMAICEKFRCLFGAESLKACLVVF